jgi:hypothetical protein
MVLAGYGTGKAMRIMRALGSAFPVLVDLEGYRHHTATCAEPFWLPGSDSLLTTSLNEVIDAQLHAGVAVALTPTGYIPAAATDVLKAALAEFAKHGRADAVFVAPLDISLLGGSYFRQTAAILAQYARPVALVLGSQGNPLDQSKDIVPNLRKLASSVPLIPIRTDFNALDLLGQGAICAAIGTGGSIRHAVDPAENDRSFNPGPAPSVLWRELLTFFKGNTIAESFGARERLAPTCGCAVCGGRRISRFLRREHQDDAIAHGVAVWQPIARQLLSSPTVGDRAASWKDQCAQAIIQHQAALDRLQRLDGLRLQPSLRQWATLPARPTEVPTPVA